MENKVLLSAILLFVLFFAISCNSGSSKDKNSNQDTDSTINKHLSVNDYSGVYKVSGENSCPLTLTITKQSDVYEYHFGGEGFKRSGRLIPEDLHGEIYFTFEGPLAKTDPGTLEGKYVNGTIVIQNYGNSINEYNHFKQCEAKFIELVKQHETELKLSEVEKNELNSFFTEFSEIYLPTFKKDNVPDSALIIFGIYYNYRHNYKVFTQTNQAYARIPEKMVSDKASEFFGIKIRKHQAFNGIEYNKNNYIVQIGDGEAYRFSQVRQLFDNGNGLLTAVIEIFNGSSGFTGDINGNPKTWKSSENSDDIPLSVGKMKATLKRITEHGKTRYELLEYLDL
ncbi:MAG: hypothetical protein P1P88_10035 [Bacteroidales bacterium]|nr:hypothetical protein [Bacteroidales bacterium]